MKKLICLIFILFIVCSIKVFSQGKVYIVLGSDTAIWDNMSTAKYNCVYNLELFKGTNTNTVKVMSDEFRLPLKDSYGNSLKMTWWMMAGNIFRFATNNDVPVPNTMTLYLMKKYFGNKIEQWQDELSLHYHTFVWTDYDNDGMYYWNQAKNFNESKDDFDVTLAQFLLEENVFPVSFRSGWHYMDNNWQNYIDNFIPYSLHNDYPAKRTFDEEPIDNIYDWSLASSEFVPFRPSSLNYQLGGGSRGWNVRSKYMGSVNQQLINQIFLKAKQGKNQLVCFWSHLPEDNFPEQIQNINLLLNNATSTYPTVKFRYCTGTEAYQRFLNYTDTSSPNINLSFEDNGLNSKLLISTNENLFQIKPIVAIKDNNEKYSLLYCEKIGQNLWQTKNAINKNSIGKIGVACIDTSGNLATEFINLLPDDKFIDNSDNECVTLYGNWVTESIKAWHIDSKISNILPGDSSAVSWKIPTNFAHQYNLFIQFPQINNHIDTVSYEIIKDGILIKSGKISTNGNLKEWLSCSTVFDAGNSDIQLIIKAKNQDTADKVLAADVVKITAYVRIKQIKIEKQFINLGDVSITDTVKFKVNIKNLGIGELSINNIASLNGKIKFNQTFPLVINGMQSIYLESYFVPQEMGVFSDTLIIYSDDPINNVIKLPVKANIENYNVIVDNETVGKYSETGNWFTSVTQAYGNTSRYAYIQNSVNGPSAMFSFKLNRNGIYKILELLPKTVNAANNALYLIYNNNLLVDSIYFNQNEGSGNWKLIGEYYLNADVLTKVIVKDDGKSSQGPVIRADAIKILYTEDYLSVKDEKSLPDNFVLYPSYPNPFNSSTTIKFSIPHKTIVKITIYDLLGNEIKELIKDEKEAGTYEIKFDASGLSSGVYFINLSAGTYIKTQKTVLLK